MVRFAMVLDVSEARKVDSKTEVLKARPKMMIDFHLRILASSASSSSSSSRDDAMYSSKALWRATSSASRSATVGGKATGILTIFYNG